MRANLVPAEVLYSNNISTARHRVYQHYSEQRILCINDNQTNLPLCNQQSYQSLRTSRLQHIHLEIFMIRLNALHRRSAGTNALVVLRDTRWEDSRQIIGTIEVDLPAGTQLVYMFPDMVLSIDDFHNHVEVAIQTHGYDTWQRGESNLLVTMAMIGRLSNTSYMGFQYSVDNFVDHPTTTGIKAIPGERRSIEELEGKRWNLKPSEQTTDYYVRYDAPKNTTPIEEIAATGWGDEFSDDETTAGRIQAYISNVISRWESKTINRLNSQTWSDNKAKLAFVENLLEESEKLMWQQWRTAYPGAYSALETIADDPQNITSQVRQLIIMEDPYRGSTEEQDRAYKDLDRITCEETKNFWSFLEDFRHAGVLPAIKFTNTFVFEMCKDAALAKELRDLSFCSAIPIPGYYKNNIKKYGIRKSRTYKGKPYNSHVKPFKRKSKEGNIASSAVYQELDLDDNWDIVSADFDDSSIYSISEGECDVHQNISIMIQDTPFEEAAFMTIEEINESDDEQNIEKDYDSHHAFVFHLGPPTKIADMVQSAGSWKPDKELPIQSKSCEHDWKENTVTNYTIYYYCGILTTDMSTLNCPKCQLTTCTLRARNYLGKTVNVKRKQQHKPEEEKDFSSNEVRLLKELLKEKTEEEFPPLENSQIARPFMEAEGHYSRNTTKTLKIRKITNNLYNVKVEFEIPSCLMFGTTAIIDTGASACFINKKVIPEEALEPLPQIIFYNGLNSRQHATHRIKQGSFLIEGNKFKIPLIYAFDMRDNNGIEMLIGANFLRSMKGGIRIEGDEITIYKKVTRIKTSSQTKIAKIAELEAQNNGNDKSGTTIDPVTGREIKGKERMVFNYKSLNDNTYKDQYSLPGINTIIKRVGGTKVFSMFDLKSGFHQVAMDEESIPCTTFLVPGGIYEWLVMPFGLKNAPPVFQRKMDKCFIGTESFITVYIDDILVFSKSEKEHAKHLEKMLKICEDNGLVLSPTKMKIAVSTIDFLGAIIREGTIKLQPQIIKKIVNFNEEELKTKKGLRSFLGILNYARNHIPNLGILLRPLYEKTNAHGDKRLKSSDYELVRKIKEQVQNLPDLEIPPENAYIIL
nr:ORFIII-like polyprotein [Tanacetum cinerariifolium]